MMLEIFTMSQVAEVMIKVRNLGTARVVEPGRSLDTRFD